MAEENEKLLLVQIEKSYLDALDTLQDRINIASAHHAAALKAENTAHRLAAIYEILDAFREFVDKNNRAEPKHQIAPLMDLMMAIFDIFQGVRIHWLIPQRSRGNSGNQIRRDMLSAMAAALLHVADLAEVQRGNALPAITRIIRRMDPKITSRTIESWQRDLDSKASKRRPRWRQFYRQTIDKFAPAGREPTLYRDSYSLLLAELELGVEQFGLARK